MSCFGFGLLRFPLDPESHFLLFQILLLPLVNPLPGQVLYQMHLLENDLNFIYDVVTRNEITVCNNSILIGAEL